MSVQVDDGGGTTMVNIGTLMLQKPAPAWDEDTLRTAEHELARVLGPMAKLIVRKAAAQTHDRVELCSMLADNIIDLEMRRKFVDAFNETGSGVRAGAGGSGVRQAPRAAARAGRIRRDPSPSRSAAASVPGTAQTGGTRMQTAPLDQAFVDQITARLAVYIGPDRTDRHQEGGARSEESQRLSAARRRQPGNAGARRIPEGSRARRRLSRTATGARYAIDCGELRAEFRLAPHASGPSSDS